MALKWRNFSFRATQNGSVSWPGGVITDPQDADNVTSVFLGGTPAYPTLSADGVNLYGSIANSNANTTDLSPTVAGNNPLLGGRLQLSSGGQYQFDAQPGVYDVRIGLSSGTGGSNRNMLVVFDGAASQVNTAVESQAMYKWQANTAYASGRCVVCSDKSVWVISAGGGGTTSTVEPNVGLGGTGTLFVDGGITWRRLAINAAIVLDATTTGSSQIIDASNTIVAPGAWGATSVQVTITGDRGNAMSVWRLFSVGTSYLRQVSMRLQAPTLASCKLFDDFGQEFTSAPQFYARQAVDMPIARIQTTAGLSTAGAFTLGGALAPYLQIKQIGSSAWICAGATPMPESLVGTRTLTVTQTDPDALNGPLVNTFSNCTVISCQSKPQTGLWSAVSTQAWIRAKPVFDLRASSHRWPGVTAPVDPSRSQRVNSAATFAAAMNGLNPASNNTLTYEILLENGVYDGIQGYWSKDFASGGLLIRPAPGHDPEFNIAMPSTQFHNVEFRGIRFPCDKERAGGSGSARDYFLFLTDPGSAGINGNGRFNSVKVSDCRMGLGYADGYNLDAAPDYAKAATFAYVKHAEFFEFTNNRMKGMLSGVFVYGAYLCIIEDNDTQRCVGDVFPVSQIDFETSTNGVFDGNTIDNFHLSCRRNVVRNDVDYAGLTNGAHSDFIQVRTFANAMRLWAANSYDPNGPDGQNTPYAVGIQILSMDTVPPAIWQVTAVTTGVLGATAPQGTSTQVNGGVTLQYVMAHSKTVKLIALLEENYINSDGPISGRACDRQMFIDSNGYRGFDIHLVAVNNCFAGPTTRGLQVSNGEIYSEFNTLVASAALSSANTAQANLPNMQQVFSNGGAAIRSRHSVVGLPTASSGAGAKLAIEDERVVNFGPTGSYAWEYPEAVLTGPFQIESVSGFRHFPTLDDTGTNSVAEFRAQMRSLLVRKAGVTAGIYPRVVINPGETAVLTKAQASAITAVTNGATVAAGLGPVTLRWVDGAGNTGSTAGADLTINVV